MSKYTRNEEINALDELWSRIDMNHDGVIALARKKFLGVWVNPTFVNSWTIADPPEQPYQYRLIFSDTFQDKGALTGGATGTIAYVAPEPWRPSNGDIHWGGHVIATGFQPARFDMNMDGEVTVTF